MAMTERDEAFENWLRTEVAAAYDELKADPSRVLSVDQVSQHLADKRRRASSTGKPDRPRPVKEIEHDDDES